MNHLISEVAEYGADAFEKAQEFNWNEDDKEQIRTLSVLRARNLSENYPDVIYDTKEIEELLEETMKDLML